MSFKLSCPLCKAEPGAARLVVLSGIFRSHGAHVHLREDGFSLPDAKQLSTDSELIYCQACKETFAISECLDDGIKREQLIAAVATRIQDAADPILCDTSIGVDVLATALRKLASDLEGIGK